MQTIQEINTIESSARPRRRRRLKKSVKIAAAVIGILLLGLLGLLIRGTGRYKRLVLKDSYTLASESSTNAAHFDDGFLRWSRNGVSLVTDEGREKWNYTYAMEAPVIRVSGGYGVIADIGAYRLCIFNKQGVCGTAVLSSPLMNVAVSENGIVAAVVDEGTTSRILYLEKTGNTIDIELTMEMSLSGYPLSLALSPDGSALMVSVLGTEQGEAKSQIVFYNFTVGKKNTNRLVGYFEYGDCLFPELCYLSRNQAVAVGDSEILFFSLSNEAKPTLTTEIIPEGELQSVSIRDGHLLTYQIDETGRQVLNLYQGDGRLLMSQEIEGQPRQLELSRNYVMLLTEDTLTLWNMKGRQCLSRSADIGGELFCVSRRAVYEWNGQLLKRYKLK